MAVSQRVASRYAKSLIELAQEKSVLDAVKEDMALLLSVISSSRDFSLMLNSPIINSEKKASVLASTFGGKVNELTSKFFDLVVKKKREADLAEIATSFVSQYDAIKGIANASVKTAISLDASSKSTIEALVAKATGSSTVVIKEEIDENLIGGYVLSLEDKQLDASVKTMLQKAKNQFTK